MTDLNSSMNPMDKKRPSIDSNLALAIRQGIVIKHAHGSQVYSLAHFIRGLFDSPAKDDFIDAINRVNIDPDILMALVDQKILEMKNNPSTLSDGGSSIDGLQYDAEMAKLFQNIAMKPTTHDRVQGVSEVVDLMWLLQLSLLRDSAEITKEKSVKQRVQFDKSGNPIRTETKRSSSGSSQSEPFEVLHYIAEDLTEEAENGDIDPVVGRDHETDLLIQTLLRWKKSAPILIGAPGVGKTAIVEGLAQRIVSGNVPDNIKNFRVWSLDVGAMNIGTAMRGAYEEKVSALLNDLEEHSDTVILFIDEIHSLFSSNSSDPSQNPGNMLKPALARGRIKIIGGTTDSDFQKMVRRDPALMRRFQAVRVAEPDAQLTAQILEGLRPSYEDYHKVSINPALLGEVQRLSSRYLSDRPNPDRSLDILDVALSKSNMRGSSELSFEDVCLATSVISGVPIDSRGGDGLNTLLERIRDKVVNQDFACEALVKSIRRHRTGLSNPNRPAGVFLLAGPTGVGKTELAKALASEAFGDPKALVRFDMSEFKEPHQISRLIGSPPGYIGHQEPGALIEAIKARPHCVLLLDEIEKAHQSIFDLFLQVFDDARLTDSQGTTASFRDVLILMTSNLGAKSLPMLGFSRQANEDQTRRDSILEAIKGGFRPEFLNRLDQTLVFSAITSDGIHRIVRTEMERCNEILRQSRFVSMSYGEDVLDWLAKNGYDSKMGARPLKRLIETTIIDSIADLVIDGSLSEGGSVQVFVEDDKISVRLK